MRCTLARASAPLSRCEVSYQLHRVKERGSAWSTCAMATRRACFVLRITAGQKARGAEVASYVIQWFSTKGE